MLIPNILCTTSTVLDKWGFVCMVGIFHAILPLYIHDLLLFDIPFISPFVYIDNRDFLREKGEVVLVLEIRERPSAWGRRKLCLFT